MRPFLRSGRGWAFGFILFVVFAVDPAHAFDAQADLSGLLAAVEHLCVDVPDGAEPDPVRIAVLLAHVRDHADASLSLPEYRGAPGAYEGFPISMPMRRLLRYLYNPRIPQEILKPFSIRSSVWLDPEAEAAQRRLWEEPWPPHGAVVIRGVQLDRTTPDASTGGCYEMTLRRALILFPEERAVLSVSVQQGESEVGTKGYFLGMHGDARYVYSGEKGLTRTGLGWVSSRVQTNISIGVYLEDGQGRVTSGVFQWMRAGWSGLSVVTSGHVGSSLARYRTLMTRRLEREIPAPEVLEGFYDSISAMPEAQLLGRAQGVFERWLDLYGEDAPRAARNILENGYAERLGRGELLALIMREEMRNYSGQSEAQASAPGSSLSFQALSTSR